MKMSAFLDPFSAWIVCTGSKVYHENPIQEQFCSKNDKTSNVINNVWADWCAQCFCMFNTRTIAKTIFTLSISLF